MDRDRITTLISELLTYDESLADMEADLRVLVTHMLKEQPHIVVDPTFALTLRKKLLHTSFPAPIPSPYQQAEAWVFRLMPLAIVGLFLILILPRGGYLTITHTSIDALERDIEERNEQILDARSGGGGYTYTTPYGDTPGETTTMSPMSTKLSTYDYGAVPAEESSRALTPLSEPPMDGFSTQSPSIHIERLVVQIPSFAVIVASPPLSDSRVVGVSPLLLPGIVENLIIHTEQSADAPTTYSVVLYRDTGDHVFSENDDMRIADITEMSLRIGAPTL